MDINMNVISDNIVIKPDNNTEIADIAELFPVVEFSENKFEKAKKIPFASLAALGTAFSQMPEAARKIVTTTTSEIATSKQLYVAVNPNGVKGKWSENIHGLTGNVVNSKGQITGRLNFKPIDKVPVVNTVESVVPFNPTMMVIAVALVTIEKKLDGIQESIDRVLKFLETDKQAKQRGNLKTLAEIAEDYRQKGNDPLFCENRNHTVQEIQRDARQNIEFYKTRISESLRENMGIHLSSNTRAYMESIKTDFAEYQLACYMYAYCAFLDIALRKDFDDASIESCRNKIENISGLYNKLFDECHSKVASYQRSTVENKVLGGIGKTVDTLGRTIGNIPLVEKGPVDELLLDAGHALHGVNKKAVKSSVHELDSFEDNRMGCFLDAIDTVDALYNQKRVMVMDESNLYVFEGSEIA